jgi:hypothetical protein
MTGLATDLPAYEPTTRNNLNKILWILIGKITLTGLASNKLRE